MKRNRLGNSELMVGEVGLGCMSIGTDQRKASEIIHAALEYGVNFLDTSDLYDEGLNEEIVGAAIQGRRREDVILATKVGNRRFPGRDGWVWDASKAYILEAVKGSLKRLRTDYIDLYQLHGGTMNDPFDETIEAFEQLKREGVIRFYGISSIRPNVIREYTCRSSIVSVMSQYSMLDRRPEESILPWLAEHTVSMIARGPVAKGILSAEGQGRLLNGYLNYTAESLRSLHPTLQEIANLSNRNISQLAIRYSLSHPSVAVAIPGASSLQQLLDNIGASEALPLTEDEITQLRVITRFNQYEQHR
ncbi:aryl-alcohol dehydrogenase-like predicted oxidoreductase [Paenibacillus taihuensis]|uniref:Aryl-alcohol dehydrogenase-like predicted oxidoreductase n=1 Tax=Paenibacillus taihuensis TaxID=1156355 RepID=A0A3D9SCL5_9BACL|nr:aldo/keto reductase [Paenibacillus taihuensis]REE91637.1 aryl-alcohol dehydrogenase-like predicted oxidoreductase [Paenibacillus taihuensis]